ncbi:condensation domain-containing protein [Streptomyces sp. NPDC050504]|uniref:condensation domain-containing protein n=1 Tax=Streptomyces sp. NPDC050504 TaxID=3365618 RepID=UPI0037ADEEA9
MRADSPSGGTAVALPPDRPAPLAPQHFRDRSSTPWVETDRAPLADAVRAVLGHYTGRPDAVVDVLGADGARGTGPAAPLVVADLRDADAGLRERAQALDSAVVLLLEADTLTAEYDSDRYTRAGIDDFLADLVAARERSARHTGTDRPPFAARRAVPVPEPVAAPEAAAPSEPPVGPVERTVARLWAPLLGFEDFRVIGRDENFFALGGGSLAAVRASNRLHELFGIERTRELMSTAVTVRTVAETVERALGARYGQVRSAAPLPRPAGTPPAVSYAQERIWLHEQTVPGTSAYHMPWALAVRGALDAQVLRGALAVVLRRHEVLRTVFVEDGGVPRAEVVDEVALPWQGHDLSGEEDPDEAARDLMARLVREPFDLAAGPLVRARLLRLAPERHVLLLDLHHLVHDGWSFGVLLGELAEAYDAAREGRAVRLPEPAVQYGDVAAHERAELTGEARERALRFWRAELEGVPPLLDLATGKPPSGAAAGAGAGVPFALDAPLARAVEDFAREHGTTAYCVLLTAFQALLHHRTGEDRLAVGTNVALRDRTDTESLIGPLFTMLPLRGDATGEPDFEELLDRARTRVLAAFAHKDVAFETLLGELAPVRGQGRPPVYQVAFELAEQARVAAPCGLEWTHDLVDTGAAKLDLILTVTLDGGEVRGLLTYAADLFDGAWAERFARDFQRLLESLLDRPRERVAALAVRALGAPPVLRGAGTESTGADNTGGAGADDPVVRVLVRLWADVLSVPAESLGPYSEFFALGGRSLDVTRLRAALRETLRTAVPVAALFRTHTVSGQAGAVLAAADDPGLVRRVAGAVLRMWDMTPQQRRALLAGADRGAAAPTRTNHDRESSR